MAIDRGSSTNTMGRMFGSTRVMAPRSQTRSITVTCRACVPRLVRDDVPAGLGCPSPGPSPTLTRAGQSYGNMQSEDRRAWTRRRI